MKQVGIITNKLTMRMEKSMQQSQTIMLARQQQIGRQVEFRKYVAEIETRLVTLQTHIDEAKQELGLV